MIRIDQQELSPHTSARRQQENPVPAHRDAQAVRRLMDQATAIVLEARKEATRIIEEARRRAEAIEAEARGRSDPEQRARATRTREHTE